MNRIALFLFYVFIVACSANKAVEEENVDSLYHLNINKLDDVTILVPSDLDEALLELEKMLHPKVLEYFRGNSAILTSEEAKKVTLSYGHRGLGLWIRNNWGLWKGSNLAKWFNEKGIRHPDDMSGIILTSFKRVQRKEPINLDKQIGKYKEYWKRVENDKQKELEESKNRERRIKEALLDWKYENRSVDLITLPQRKDFGGTWKILPYQKGFLIVFKGYKKSEYKIWHDGIYYWGGPEDTIHPVSFDNCGIIIDVQSIADSTYWLCKNDRKWRLITERNENQKLEEIKLNSAWLRIGVRDTEIILFDSKSFYSKENGKWVMFYQNANESMHRLFDHDEDGLGRGEIPWSFPRRCDTPIIYNEFAYFWSAGTGNEKCLWRLDLSDNNSNFENFQDFFGYQYYGRLFIDVTNIQISPNGGIIVSTGHWYHDTLVYINEVGYKIPIFAGRVDYSVSFDRGKLAFPDLKTEQEILSQIPASAVSIYGENMYLAGRNGLYSVCDKLITPVVRFKYPNSISHKQLQEGYKYRIEPQRLAVFSDNTFLIGDQHSGIYLLSKDSFGKFTLSLLHENIGEPIQFQIHNKTL